MAKWDLSKLPEGRKPLPDEWFAERAQMQERLNMLEAELAEYKHVASAIDTQWAESQDEIADLKAKLDKAVDALGEAIYLLDPDEEDIAKETGLHRIVTTYAELTGGKDE